MKPGAEEAPALKWVVELETDPSNEEGLEAGAQDSGSLQVTTNDRQAQQVEGYDKHFKQRFLAQGI